MKMEERMLNGTRQLAWLQSRKLNRGTLEIHTREDTAEILIYGVIGEDPWGEGGITAERFVRELRSVNAKTIQVRINSPGGDAFDGLAIYNALRRKPALIETHVDGLAASAAATIAMAGDHISIAENAFLMIHRSWAFVVGNTTDMMETADVLSKLDEGVAKIFSSRTNKSNSRMLNLMEAETWLNSDEAKSENFVDEITGVEGAKQIDSRFDLSAYRNSPDGLGIFSGARLAALLNRLIDERETNQRSRSEIIEDMADAAGIDSSTVNQILSGSIECPPIDRLEGFASALRVSTSSLVSAAEQDGCEYNSENAAMCNRGTLRDEGVSNVRHLERVLRDEGYTNSQAKLIVSRCKDLVQRDAGMDRAIRAIRRM